MNKDHGELRESTEPTPGVFCGIPSSWKLAPVYARFEVRLGKMLDAKQITRQHLAPYLRNVDVQWDHVNTYDLPEMDFDEAERQKLRLLPGDLLVCEGGEAGRTAIWQSQLPECYYQKAIHRLRPITDSDNPRYFFWVMRYVVSQGHFSAHGSASTIEHLPAEKLRIFRYPAPSLETQRRIADYLDRETARIDALIAAKERFLALLAEKRRALITHAVTRGLNPNAPLRDSGLPWVGRMPIYWEVWKVAHFATVGNGSTPSRENAAYWQEGTIPWLNSSVVNRQEATDAEQFVTEIALRECHLPMVSPGSLLVAITGQGKTRGSAVVLSFEATINQHLAYLTPNGTRADVWYVRWLLLAAYDFLRAMSDDAGGTKGALTCEELKTMRIPVPPLAEQRAIVAFIERETGKLDALRAATECTIGLLRERRSALIAAAVTGRIAVGEVGA